MSFSFYVTAKTLRGAFRLASEQLEGVSQTQPVHQKDIGLVTETLAQYLFGLASEPAEGEFVGVNVVGSISTVNDDVRSASIAININIMADTGS